MAQTRTAPPSYGAQQSPLRSGIGGVVNQLRPGMGPPQGAGPPPGAAPMGPPPMGPPGMNQQIGGPPGNQQIMAPPQQMQMAQAAALRGGPQRGAMPRR